MILKLCLLVLVAHTCASPYGSKELKNVVEKLFYANDKTTRHGRDEVSTEQPKGSTLVPPIGGYIKSPTHCELEDGSKGYCVQSYLCEDEKIVTDGGGAITERKYECQAPKVCCKLDTDSVKPTPPSEHRTDKAMKGSTLVPPVDVNLFRPTRCEFEDGRFGRCVPPRLCNKGKIIQDGSGAISERNLQCWQPDTCCELENEKLIEMTPRTLVPPIKDRKPGEPCEAWDGSQGLCVLVHLCTNDTTIIDGSSLISERQADPCVVWRGGIQLCCPAKYLVGKIIPGDPESTTELMTRTNEKDDSCIAKDHSQGVCVPHYQCDDEYDGSGVINARYQGSCKASYICCTKGKVDKTQTPATPLAKETCGIVNPDGLWPGQEIGPLEAKFGQFPWMVAVRTKSSRFPENYNITGGSLIHPSVVLTVAHYVARAVDQDVKVRAGEWNTLDVDEPLPHQEVGVKTIVQHPDYNKRNYRNDIALLFLEKPIQLLPHIGVACLPPSGAVVAPSTDCIANGWGKDQYGSKGVISNILKKLTLPAVDHPDCQARLRTTRLGEYFQLHEGFMCAGGERLDTCALDGGSPLTCPTESNPNKHIQYGVVSWGVDCHLADIPGVYMNVAHYRDWIDQHMRAEGFDTSVYTA